MLFLLSALQIALLKAALEQLPTGQQRLYCWQPEMTAAALDEQYGGRGAAGVPQAGVGSFGATVGPGASPCARRMAQALSCTPRDLSTLVRFACCLLLPHLASICMRECRMLRGKITLAPLRQPVPVFCR